MPSSAKAEDVRATAEAGVAGAGGQLPSTPGKRTLTNDVQLRATTPSTAKAEDVRATAEAGVAGAGGQLPHLATIQESFGRHDVSSVRAHFDGAARDASHEIGAEGYAVGNDVAFERAPTLHTAAHEAAHAVQQRSGVQLKSGVGEAGDAYEKHADRVAEAVVAGKSAEKILDEKAGGGGSGSTAVQKFDRHHATGPAGEGPNTVKDGGATETDAHFDSADDIGKKTISDFVTYSDAQADWSIKIADIAKRDELRALLTWLRAGFHRVTALDSFLVKDVLAVKVDLAALDAYSRARGTKTVPVDAQPTVADALSWGKDVVKLESATNQTVLHAIFTADAFDDLRKAGQVDMFVTYVKTCKPLLQAKGGVEIASFLTLAKTADPSSFTDIKDVRNYHRFDHAALLALRAAQPGNPTNKPLTLILHSALDHNGAFHHDPELTTTITAASNHTIMIEGVESLDALGAKLPDVVAVHGREEPDPEDAAKKVRRIDQVMMAGHGSSQSIELTGSLKAGKDGKAQADEDGSLVVNDDDLNVHSDKKDPASVKKAARTKAFMQQVMSLMSQDPATPHGRIVFNACLTASNEIDPDKIDPKAKPADQAKAMLKEINNSPSLVTAMKQVAADGGRKVDVRGGNGSFEQVGLIDGKGALDIVADGTDPDGDGIKRTNDPELTNPDKLVYAEQGTDPDGAMSAVAESWAKDQKKTIDAVGRRRKTPKPASWKETVIQVMYELVETRYAANGAGIARLASVTEGFSELPSTTQADVRLIWNLQADEDWKLLETKLSATGEWKGALHMPLVFYEGWMFQNATKQGTFLGALGAMTVRTSQNFLYMRALYDHWDSLVPATSANPPDGGQLRLALRDVVDGSSKAHSKTFLSSLVVSHAFVVDINPALDKVKSSDDILRALGLHPSQAAGKAVADPKSPPPDSNVDMTDDGKKNDAVVEAMSATGRVTAAELYVRDQPRLQGKNHPVMLKKDDLVYVMGQTGEWYLIDHSGVRGYSHKSFIELV